MGFFKRPVEILLVEDSPAEIEIVREMLGTEDRARLRVMEDGEEAIDYLAKRGKSNDAALPDLILLDWNLPKKSGREVLQYIKNDPALTGIPVVVLSGSEAEKDMMDSYLMHGNCYIAKPGNIQATVRVLHAVLRFWLNFARLPRTST